MRWRYNLNVSDRPTLGALWNFRSDVYFWSYYLDAIDAL